MFWDWVLYLCTQHPHKSASNGAVCFYNGLWPQKLQVLNAFVCCFSPLISKDKNLKRERAYPWAAKMNYFGICSGSVRLSILELHNFSTHLQPVSKMAMRIPYVLSCMWAKRTVSRVGLFHKNNSTLEHQSYLIWLLFLLYF